MVIEIEEYLRANTLGTENKVHLIDLVLKIQQHLLFLQL